MSRKNSPHVMMNSNRDEHFHMFLIQEEKQEMRQTYQKNKFIKRHDFSPLNSSIEKEKTKVMKIGGVLHYFTCLGTEQPFLENKGFLEVKRDAIISWNSISREPINNTTIELEPR